MIYVAVVAAGREVFWSTALSVTGSTWRIFPYFIRGSFTRWTCATLTVINCAQSLAQSCALFVHLLRAMNLLASRCLGLAPGIRQKPKLGIELAQACFRVAREAGAPLIFENVRLAQRWLGRAITHCGPFYLWGDGVPALCHKSVPMRKKESYGSKERAKRAEIPPELSDWIARQYVCVSGSSGE